MEELEFDLNLDFSGIEDYEVSDDLPLELGEPTEEVETIQETAQEEVVAEETTDDLEIQPEVIETTKFHDLASEKIKLGEWEDVIVEIDGEEVKLSEFKNLDEETYQEILKNQKEIQKQELEQNFTSVKGLTETQKNLIEIIKSGDYEQAKELFQEPSHLKEPFQNYDPSVEAYNEQVFQIYYKSQGIQDSRIKAMIKVAKEEGTLEDEAMQIVEGAREQFRKNVESKKAELQEQKKQEEINRKSYAKEVEGQLKQLGIESQTLAKKMATTAIKQTESGDFEVDLIYDEKMKDPKEAAETIFFLTNKEEYLKWVKNNSKKEVHKEVLKTINIIRPSSKQTQTEQKNEQIFELEL